MVLWQGAAFILVVAGLAGSVIPVLPGSLLVLGGLLLAAWVDGFQYVGSWTIGILIVLTTLTYIVDFAASALGAKKLGAAPQAIWGAAAGAVVGLLFGLPGFLLGPFAGAMLMQYRHDQDWVAAGKVGVGAWFGMAVGMALKLSLAFLMIGIYLVARYL